MEPDVPSPPPSSRRPTVAADHPLSIDPGYIVLLVLAAGMSVFAVVQPGNVTDVTHSIIFDDNRLIGLHKELTDTLLSETRYEKKFLIMQDRALLDGFLQSGTEFARSLAEARAWPFWAPFGLMQNLLHQHNIPSVTRGYYHRALLYFFGPYIEISTYVPQEKLNDADAVIKGYLRNSSWP